ARPGPGEQDLRDPVGVHAGAGEHRPGDHGPRAGERAAATRVMDAHTAPHLEAAALISIDVQRDTLDGRSLEIPGTSAALAAMARLADAFRHAGRPIVHVVRLYREDGSNADLCRRRLVEGGARILAPGDE